MSTTVHIPPGRAIRPVPVGEHQHPEAGEPVCVFCAGPATTALVDAAQASDPIMVCGVHLEHVQRVSGCGPSFLAERWRGLRRAGQALGSDDSLTLLIAAGLRLGRGEDLVRVSL